MVTYVVNTLKDHGQGSLREALNEATDDAKIVFTVFGTIKLKSDLPNISHNRIILDATTLNYEGEPLITIDCYFHNGLNICGSNCQIIGIIIKNSSKNGLNIIGSNNFINQCHFVKNKKNGIYIFGNDNQIGENKTNDSNFISNKISKNCKSGIFLKSCHGNVLIKNQITSNGKDGITFNKSHDNIIGGTIYTNSDDITNNPTGTKGTVTPVFIIPPLGNHISKNKRNGIKLENNSFANNFYGNFIGTSFDGNSKEENKHNGVFIFNSNNNIFKGCEVKDEPFVYYNIISGNHMNGMLVKNSKGTIIQGNYFGLNAHNDAPLANKKNGLLVNGNSSHTIVGGIIPLGNNMSANKKNGIHVADRANDFISFNSFTGLASFGGALPNGENGILITSSGSKIVLRTNVCSGNLKNGIKLAKFANHVECDPNLCGTATNGTSALPNLENGLLICDDACFNIISSSTISVIPNSTFSCNALNGIQISDRAHDNVIVNCAIGLDTILENPLNNSQYSFLFNDECYGNCIVDSFISGIGILTKNTTFNKILNNQLGVNRFDQPLPNDTTQIFNFNAKNIVL